MGALHWGYFISKNAHSLFQDPKHLISMHNQNGFLLKSAVEYICKIVIIMQVIYFGLSMSELTGGHHLPVPKLAEGKNEQQGYKRGLPFPLF